ncbi:MAG: hypothetical protein ACRENC_00925, partial [Gemmatimonadaceae bacterium]
MAAVIVAISTAAAMPMCAKDDSAPATPPASSAAAPATTGPGLPSDFPLMKGLAACKPLVTGPEVTCEWHGVNGHAVYTFYHAALPKAGYTLLP